MRGRLLIAVALSSALAAGGCKHAPTLDTRPLDQAGMWFESVQQLRELNVSQAEIAQLARARDAGVSDAGCVELVKMARSHQQPFADGDAVAGLSRAGAGEATILELARLNQLASWSGEALALRLAGMSDAIVLALARQRAAGQQTLSGASLSRLKSTGLTEAQLLELIRRGTTDAQAKEIVAARERAASPKGFVRRSRRRR